MKEKEYVEDSTKGAALINPLNYKGDVLVQVWMDSRVLATLDRWLINNFEVSQYMSQVVRQPLEILAAHLVDESQAEMIDDTYVARAMLQNRFNVNLNKDGRGMRNVKHNQVLSERRSTLAGQIKRTRPYDVHVPSRTKITCPVDLDKAVKIYNELEAQGSFTKEGMTNSDAEEFARKDAEKQAAEKALMDDFLNKQKER